MKHAAFVLAIVTGLIASAGLAQTCPAPPDHGPRIETLIMRFQDARSGSDARLVSDQLWALWTDAPDQQAQAMLDRGMTRRRSFDFPGALEDLDALVAYCPDYAEGYNQRAFVNYLRQDFATALRDLDRAIALSPSHIGARRTGGSPCAEPLVGRARAGGAGRVSGAAGRGYLSRFPLLPTDSGRRHGEPAPRTFFARQ